MNKAICIIILIIFGYFTWFTQNIAQYSELNNNITIGSSLNYLKSGASFNSFFIPEFSFSPNRNLKLTTGLISSVRFSNLEKRDFTNYKNYVYAQSEYKISQKLILTGDIIYGTNDFAGQNAFSDRYNVKSYSFGTIYKVNENLQFQFNVRQTNRKNQTFDNYDIFYFNDL